MNLCRSCGLDFQTVAAFDEHRVGEHGFTFWEGLALDPPREDGRRCLNAEEMEQAGWGSDRWGRWRAPGKQVREVMLERVTL